MSQAASGPSVLGIDTKAIAASRRFGAHGCLENLAEAAT